MEKGFNLIGGIAGHHWAIIIDDTVYEISKAKFKHHDLFIELKTIKVPMEKREKTCCTKAYHMQNGVKNTKRKQESALKTPKPKKSSFITVINNL